MKNKKNMLAKAFSMLLGLSVMLIGLPANVVMASAFNGYGTLNAGTYTGSAEGYGGDLTVNVTVNENSEVTDIAVQSHKETASYYEKGCAIIDTILEKQSVEVDTVSSATRTSNAIKEAVSSALDQAAENASLTNDKEEPEEYDSTIFNGGSGSKEDPYRIANEEQLRAFAVSMAEKLDYAGLYVQLEQDIEVSSEPWTPIGEGEYAFAGTFDGGGHSVTGIAIGSAEMPYQDNGGVYYGFFGVVGADADVRNLKLDVNIYVQGGASIYAGGLAGCSDGACIDGVTVNGTVWGKSGKTKSAANHFSGGIAGMALRSVITNCVSHASVYGEAYGGAGEAGGILGMNNRTLTANCLSDGAVSGTADRALEGMAAVGGIAGVHAGTMVNCVALGDTSSLTYSQHVGALAGWTTGIGELYGNFYSLDAKQTIEKQAVNPVAAVGWLVGPGVNDEGEAYTGSVEYSTTGLSGEQLQADALAAAVNQAFQAFPVDMADYDNPSLYQWKNTEGTALPVGAAAQVTYAKPDIPEVTEPEISRSGIFYGRSDDQSVIVRLTVENNVICQAEAVQNTTGQDAVQILDAVVKANGAAGITQKDALGMAVKSAVEKALEHMGKNDTTSYGKADSGIFAGGAGTKESPYQIATQEQLRAFAASINTDESYEGVYLELTADIALTGQWVPAGTDSHYPFKGTFDGNGHSIRGLQIGTEEAAADIQYAGLFAYIEGGTVVDIVLEAPYIHIAKTDNTRIYAGALASFVDQNGTQGYFDRCRVVDGDIHVATASGAGYAGGLFGSAMYGTVTNTTVDAEITAKSTGAWTYAGVMIGTSARMGLVNNAVTGTVSADAPLNKAAIGGLTGFHSGASYNNVADVTLASSGVTGDVGAIAGRNTGIGLMLSGYFNSERGQKAGASSLTPSGVGTIVTGEREGKGAAEGLSGMTAAKLNAPETVNILNANKSAENASLRRVLALLSDSWKAAYPESIVLLDWQSGSTLPVLNYAASTEVKPDTAKPGKVILSQVQSTSYQSIKLTWEKASGAAGYEIYRASSKNGAYKNIKTTGSGTVSYTDKKLTTGKTYYYKVRAVAKPGNAAINGEFSDIKAAKPVPAKAVLKSVKNVKGKKAAIKWKKVKGATGYAVYRSTSRNGKYRMVKKLNSRKKINFTNTALKKKTYYYKVRAYTKVKGKIVYGAYSDVKKVKIVK